MPAESTRAAYLLPVDARSSQLKTCYPIEQLYSHLSALNAKSVTVLLDACFSGSLRGDGMLMSARGVAIKPKVDEPRGSMVVLTAANGEQTAEWGRRDSWRTKRLRFGKGSATIGESQPQVPIAHRVGVARD